MTSPRPLTRTCTLQPLLVVLPWCLLPCIWHLPTYRPLSSHCTQHLLGLHPLACAPLLSACPLNPEPRRGPWQRLLGPPHIWPYPGVRSSWTWRTLVVTWVLSSSPSNVLFSHRLTGSLPGLSFHICKAEWLSIYREHRCHWIQDLTHGMVWEGSLCGSGAARPLGD